VTRAIGCISGGLDSLLAVRLIQEQGIDVLALHVLHLWHAAHTPPGEMPAAVRRAQALGAEVRTVDGTEADLALLHDPPHGFGKHLNPCIDCRIWTLRQARQLMEEDGAAFVFTGEVVGQRPMSQRRDALRLVEKEAGLTDLLVRPLSAKCLPPTRPEREGVLDRERLLDISGRSRKRQMALARDLGVTDYATPAGGCLLTDPGFAHRLRELMRQKEPTRTDVELLKVGRHLRLDDGTWIVVGRHQADNERLEALVEAGDVRIEPADVPGPTTIVRSPAGNGAVEQAAAVTLRYTKVPPGESRPVTVQAAGEAPRTIHVAPAKGAFCRAHLIALEESP
jgi:tRNA U34 2-thiouridine synthase MnmA/TrmU